MTLDAKEVPNNYRNNELILFIGKQPTNVINQIYRIVDFLIFPSLNESLGLPLIEASLFNLPIIAANLITYMKFVNLQSHLIQSPLKIFIKK